MTRTTHWCPPTSSWSGPPAGMAATARCFRAPRCWCSRSSTHWRNAVRPTDTWPSSRTSPRRSSATPSAYALAASATAWCGRQRVRQFAATAPTPPDPRRRACGSAARCRARSTASSASTRGRPEMFAGLRRGLREPAVHTVFGCAPSGFWSTAAGWSGLRQQLDDDTRLYARANLGVVLATAATSRAPAAAALPAGARRAVAVLAPRTAARRPCHGCGGRRDLVNMTYCRPRCWPPRPWSRAPSRSTPRCALPRRGRLVRRSMQRCGADGRRAW